MRLPEAVLDACLPAATRARLADWPLAEYAPVVLRRIPMPLASSTRRAARRHAMPYRPLAALPGAEDDTADVVPCSTLGALHDALLADARGGGCSTPPSLEALFSWLTTLAPLFLCLHLDDEGEWGVQTPRTGWRSFRRTVQRRRRRLGPRCTRSCAAACVTCASRGGRG